MRRSRGLTQADLADRLGLTFQQVQKYERGANRISVSKLYEIAHVLETPINHFFDGLPASAPEIGEDSLYRSLERLIAIDDGLAIAQSFPNIPTSGLRRAVFNLVRAVTGSEI